MKLFTVARAATSLQEIQTVANRLALDLQRDELLATHNPARTGQSVD